MILRSFILFSMYMQLSLTATARINGNRHEPAIECAAKGGECDETKGRPVCGTDDQTYPSRCHLLRIQCTGHQVSIKYRGSCRACKDTRDYALKHKSTRTSPPNFIPRCKPDGTYAPIQCLGDTGCWCSDITGKPIENSTVRTGKPKCQRANTRRSPSRHITTHRLGRRQCIQIDRAAFNMNLLNVFQSEYIRSGQHQRDVNAGLKGADTITNSNVNAGNNNNDADKLILDWKFAHLDVNGNRILDKIEFRELKKLVKRAVKPRRCGRAFGKFCDVDNDERLSRVEWNSCISKDGINRYHHVTVTSQNPNNRISTNGSSNNNDNNNNMYPNYLNHRSTQHYNNHNSNNNNKNNLKLNHHSTNNKIDILTNENLAEEVESNQQNIDYDDDSNEYTDEDDSIGAIGGGISILNRFGSSTNLSSIYFLRPKETIESPLKEVESETGCLADQAEVKNEDSLLYVPECTPDGRYQRVQCYRSTPYCWCVNEDTGKNIPGTSVKNKRPQCDNIYPVIRPMKGCPEPKKIIFLKDLKQFLLTHFLGNTNMGSNTTNWNSDDERIATLSFVLLDKNKNKAWERKEWKMFREMVTNSKNLRKCGKRMPRYCDVNSDKKITLSEWLTCLQAQKIELTDPQSTLTQTSESTVTKKPSKLIGSNPLERYLKD